MSLLVLSTPLFTNGTAADATQVTGDFTNILTWANGNVDNVNVGAAGFFASQIKPTTQGQGILGGAVSYTFPAGLVVNSGVLAVSGPGAYSAPAAAASGDLVAQRTGSTGALLLGNASGAGKFDFGVTTAAQFTASAAITAAAMTLGLTVPTASLPAVIGTDGTHITIAAFSAGGHISLLNNVGASPASVIMGGLTATTGAFSSTVTSEGVYLPPVYTAAGVATPSTIHAVSDQLQAVGSTTTVTLSGAAAFSNAGYAVIVYDVSSSGFVTGLSSIAGGSFSFPSTSGHFYNIFAFGS